jgi:hypothetical protein
MARIHGAKSNDDVDSSRAHHVCPFDRFLSINYIGGKSNVCMAEHGRTPLLRLNLNGPTYLSSGRVVSGTSTRS